MMLQQLIICFIFLLQHSVVWAGSLDVVVSSLNILAGYCNQADEDVQAINAVSGLIDAQKISEDIQSIGNYTDLIISFNQGVAATAVVAQEELLTNGFNDATEALDKYLGDLQEKASDLNELGQGGAIYTALQILLPTYANFSTFIQGLVTDEPSKNAATATGGDGIAAIGEASDTYEPASLL